MKKEIQPQVYNDTLVTCVCGNKFTTSSVLKNITVEICSNCHPFYTGQQKFVDTEGRIEKFTKKAKISESKKLESKGKISKKKSHGKAQEESKTSLKDLLKQAKESKE
jgi:large subunit ribosomal protein L31